MNLTTPRCVWPARAKLGEGTLWSEREQALYRVDILGQRTWGGLLAPAGTPKPVVAKISAEVTRILTLPDVKQRLMDAGVEPVDGTPEQYSAFIGKEMVKWAKVAKDAGIQPE